MLTEYNAKLIQDLIILFYVFWNSILIMKTYICLWINSVFFFGKEYLNIIFFYVLIYKKPKHYLPFRKDQICIDIKNLYEIDKKFYNRNAKQWLFLTLCFDYFFQVGIIQKINLIYKPTNFGQGVGYGVELAMVSYPLNKYRIYKQ